MKIKELGPDDRPREKLLGKGAGALSNAELVAILLRTGSGGDNALLQDSQPDVQDQRDRPGQGGKCRCRFRTRKKVYGRGLLSGKGTGNQSADDIQEHDTSYEKP